MKTSIAGCRCQAPWAQQRWTSGHVHGRSLNTCLREPRGADRSRSGDPEHPLRGAGSRGGTRGPSRCSSGSRKGCPGSRSPADLSSRCTTCNCSTAPWPRPPAAPESRSPTWTPDDVSSGCRGLAGQIPHCKQIRIAWRDPYLRWVLSLRGGLIGAAQNLVVPKGYWLSRRMRSAFTCATRAWSAGANGAVRMNWTAFSVDSKG
jgi:hypothetical protein